MNSHPNSPAHTLRRWERTGLWRLLVVIIAFGGIVEMRSVFLKRRMADADDYFRAAWAVRTGQDMYSVADSNGWPYNDGFEFIVVDDASTDGCGERA